MYKIKKLVRLFIKCELKNNGIWYKIDYIDKWEFVLKLFV